MQNFETILGVYLKKREKKKKKNCLSSRPFFPPMLYHLIFLKKIEQNQTTLSLSCFLCLANQEGPNLDGGLWYQLVSYLFVKYNIFLSLQF